MSLFIMAVLIFVFLLMVVLFFLAVCQNGQNGNRGEHRHGKGFMGLLNRYFK